MRAVLLGRVSTDDKDQDPENQLRPLREVARRHEWIVVKELSRKVSAWNDKTAEAVWQECLELIAKGEADELVVWSWDRLSRRGIADAFHKISVLEEHYGARFYSLQEPFLSTGADPMTRELLLAQMSWNAKWESEHKSQRVKAAYRAKRAHASAVVSNGRARWGRPRASGEVGRVPSEADVQEIRSLRANRVTLAEISKRVELSVGTVWNVLHDDRFQKVPFENSKGPRGGGSNSGLDFEKPVLDPILPRSLERRPRPKSRRRRFGACAGMGEDLSPRKPSTGELQRGPDDHEDDA